MEFYAYAVAVLLWLSMIAYAVLGGADFGGGIWNLLSFGRKGEEVRALIRGAVGPVWEANNVWIIFVVVGLYTGFPIVAASLANALFIPLTLSLIGIVLRGASFAFRTHFTSAITVKATWGSAFGIASLITPFCWVPVQQQRPVVSCVCTMGRCRYPPGKPGLRRSRSLLASLPSPYVQRLRQSS